MDETYGIFMKIFTAIEAMGIIFFFSLAFYYGAQAIRCEKEKTTCSWLNKYSTVISAIWVVIFLVIFVSIVIDKPVLKPDEFGAIFIRPAILLTSVKIYITGRMEYIKQCRGGDYPCRTIQK